MRQCGHEHQEFDPLPRGADVPARWRVTELAHCNGLALSRGTVLEFVLTDQTFQGCAGCESHIVWSRYRVTNGRYAGSCVEFQVIDPRPLYVMRPMIPDWLEPEAMETVHAFEKHTDHA